MGPNRYQALDNLRGLTLVSMVVYHAMWDLVYMFQVSIPWYRTTGAYIWQQSICWTFILLSGFCWSMGRRKVKHAISVLLVSTIISLVTIFLMPENLILFGVLSAIGSSMLVMIPLDRVLRRMNPYVGCVGSLALFVVTRNVNVGTLGYEAWRWIALPREWYANLFTAYLGFPPANFWSCDYFSVIPWIFLYQTGYFLYMICSRRGILEHLHMSQLPLLSWLGRHSLMVYALHQPIVYAVLAVVMRMIG